MRYFTSVLTCKRVFIFFVLFSFFLTRSHAAVFVVTSNADSGPGTLRDALTQAAANGTAEKDYINFNLPGNTEADITIAVQTQLPDVTGNVIIDGSTQPGAPLGVSGAHVIITPVIAMQNLNAFNVSTLGISTVSVEFYGLYIKGFRIDGIAYGSGIIVNNDCKLVIGAPGKGNVISGNNVALSGSLANALIQSNFIGLEPDGETALPNIVALYTDDYDGLLIGGDDPADGNVFIGERDYVISLGDGVYGTGTTVIKNNFFGTDYTGTKPVNNDGEQSYIYVYIANINLTVTENVFNNNCEAIGFLAVGACSLTIKGNYFGTDKSQTHAFSATYGQKAMDLTGFLTTVIGGDNDADQNIFTGYYNSIYTDNLSYTDIVKNKFYCNTGSEVDNNKLESNYVRIIKLFDTEVSGDAPPGATVQLYYSTAQCTTCNPNKWFATVTADASGKWDYIGDTKQNVMASSTVNNNTVGYQPYFIDKDEVTVTNMDCNHATGSLAIAEPREGRFQFIWKDSNGKIVSTKQTISGLPAGVYTLEINEGGNCPKEMGSFTIVDLTPHINRQAFQLDCNNLTGYFFGPPYTLSNIAITKYYWLNEKGVVFSNDATVANLPAGNYYLYVTDNDGCNSETVLCQVLPPAGAPIIDDSKAIVNDADCNFSDGSITGLSISNLGNSDFGWAKSDGTVTAHQQLDLKQAPPGQYYFFADYESNCPVVESRLFTIGSKNGVKISSPSILISPAACGGNDGYIKNLTITGATQYQWTDANNKVVGTNADLLNVPAGDYILTASNNFGCSATSQAYTVTQQPPTQFPPYQDVITSSCFGNNNGAISVTTDALVKSARWVDSQGQPAGSGSSISNLAAGTYQLYLTDQNGCESFYNTYTVGEIPEFTVTENGQVTDEICGLKNGSIANTTINGGIPPYTYTWKDAGGNEIGTTNSIANLAAGSYTLNVVDTRCGDVDISFTVSGSSEDVPPPSVSNVQLCSSGDALLLVNNPSATTTYRLYDSQTSTVPLDEQTGGKFKITVNGNRSYYVSQLSGTCESSRAGVQVTVGISAINIANTFTPNGDEINDYWIINGIENYPDAQVQVFTRYGQKVFESKGYAKPFDGTYNGNKLPVGAYYYIINLNTNCNLISGSLTIIR